MNPGTKLGTFEIIGLLGKGGMGEVYRAQDTKLGREVAIKVLSEEVAQDPERLARFEREAMILATLDHPNIGGIYDLQSQNSTHFLVMQLVEGETLFDRINTGSIPHEEAVSMFMQIAEALEQAHEAGIVHRDLKPANIKITPDGNVKVLDFGIAKSTNESAGFGMPTPTPGSTPDPLAPTRLSTPTPKFGLTGEGVLIGTPGYMSPEQTRGRRVDKRTDIWAFGVCLYETLTGTLPFEGETVSDTFTAILRDDPDWDQLPADTPPSIRKLLKRCLQRDLKLRLRDIGEAWVHLHQKSEEDGITQGTANTNRNVSRFTIRLPEGVRLSTSPAPIRFSPDGQTILISGVKDRVRRLYTRPMNDLSIKPLDGTNSAHAPFYSPDGEWLGFFQGMEMKKLRLKSNTVQTITRTQARVTHAIWTDNDTIIWAEVDSGLRSVSASGGPTRNITELDEDKQEQRHIPSDFVGNRSTVLTIVAEGSLSISHLELVDVLTGSRNHLASDLYQGQYIAPGIVMSGRRGMALALPLSPDLSEVSGNAVPVLEGVQSDFEGVLLAYYVSVNGDLVYAPAEQKSESNALYWVTPDGGRKEIQAPSNVYFGPRISPDGELLAVMAYDRGGKPQIYLYDLNRGVLEMISHDGSSSTVPVWSPDSNKIAYTTMGEKHLCIRVFDLNDGTTKRFHESDVTEWPASFSPDGKTLAYIRNYSITRTEIWTHTEGTDPEPFVNTDACSFCARFDSSGEFIAYVSDESGRWETYIKPFGKPGRRLQVSINGGVDPVWSPDGQTLYYRSGNSILRVSLKYEGRLRISQPEVLFEFPFGVRVSMYAPGFDIHPDGDRFIMTESTVDPQGATELIVVQNWTEELKKLLDSDKTR